MARREHVRFTSYQTSGHSYVIPEDAMPLLAAKTMDLRLFDVDELRNYHGTLPLIVKYTSGQRSLAQTAGAIDLPSIDGTAVKADPATFWAGLTGPALRSNAASTLQSRGIAKICWTGSVTRRWTTACRRSARRRRGRPGTPARA
jgi:hypothetical protein